MSDFARISKNSLYSFLSTLFRLFANIILFWLIARFYGKEIFGQFTIAQTFASVFVFFADFGLDILLTTELPRDLKNSSKIFQRLFSIKFVLSLTALVGMVLISVFSSFSGVVKSLIIIFSFYALFTTLTNFLYALFKGNERLEYETKVSFFVNTTSLFFVLLLILLKENIIVVAIGFTAMRFVGLIVALYFSYQVLPSILFRLDFSKVKDLIHQVVIYGLFLIFGNLYFQLDTILLAFWKGPEEVGIYQAVFRLVMLPLLIPEVFINSIMPTLSRFNSENILKWQKLSFFLNKFLVIIGIPLSIFIFMFSDQLINIVYGKKEYSSAIPVLKIFAVIILVRFMSETRGLMLTTSRKQKIRMLIVVAATIINFLINLVVIPKYSFYGAAVTSLITNVLVGILFFYFTRSEINLNGNGIIKPGFLLIILTMIALFWLLNIINAWYLGFVFLSFYFVYVYKYNLTGNEKKYLLELRLIRFKSIFK